MLAFAKKWIVVVECLHVSHMYSQKHHVASWDQIRGIHECLVPGDLEVQCTVVYIDPIVYQVLVEVGDLFKDKDFRVSLLYSYKVKFEMYILGRNH